MESLEQQLEDSQVEKFNIKQMKDLFEQKAAQLATEIVGKLSILIAQYSVVFLFKLKERLFKRTPFSTTELKAKYDEETSLRELAEQKVTNLTQELQKQKGVCEDLNTELVILVVMFYHALSNWKGIIPTS